MELPNIQEATLLNNTSKRLLIAAYGFEERSVGWSTLQKRQGKILDEAVIVKYEPEKGENRITELRSNLVKLGVDYPNEISFNFLEPEKFEKKFEVLFREIEQYDEVIVDITAMTKFLILVILCQLQKYSKVLRIIYTEAAEYSPTFSDYNKYKEDLKSAAQFPSQGFKIILRAKCLSSIRMQGQPVALIAFTSFNEQLVRHMLGTISPYRLIFINGSPPRSDYEWREMATQFIHTKLIEDYRNYNPTDKKTGLLKTRSSTLLYEETIDVISKIYETYGMYERLIFAATGSKMQTVGLFFGKMKYPDIHVEYPTPDSYFLHGMSRGIRKVHEITIPKFFSLIENLKNHHVKDDFLSKK